MLNRLTPLTLLTLLGCDLGFIDDDTTSTDTADTGAGDVEALIQVWCVNENCSQVGLYGGESLGNIVSYTWAVDGNELASGPTETSTVLDMSGEVGNLLDATLTVEDSDGATSEAHMLVGNLGTQEAETIQAIVVMPPPISCGSAIPVVSIGGCVSNLKGLHFEAWDHDPTGTSTSLRQDGVIDFAFASGGSLTNVGFAEAAAWYLTANHPVVMLHNIDPVQYVIGAQDFPPSVVDPIIGQPAPSPTIYTQHVSFWFTARTDGTDVRFRHTLSDGTSSSNTHMLQANCSSGTLSFSIAPAN
jgi:hypothetical protein